jgi:hypothetical protein
MALKCNCVTVRRDFDNESSGRRELRPSAQEVRDEVIPLNPWQQNETELNHPIAIAMEHQLLICE